MGKAGTVGGEPNAEREATQCRFKLESGGVRAHAQGYGEVTQREEKKTEGMA